MMMEGAYVEHLELHLVVFRDRMAAARFVLAALGVDVAAVIFGFVFGTGTCEGVVDEADEEAE